LKRGQLKTTGLYTDGEEEKEVGDKVENLFNKEKDEDSMIGDDDVDVAMAIADNEHHS